MMSETIILPTALAVPLLVGLLVLFAWLNLAGDRHHARNRQRAKALGYDRRPLYRAASAWDGLMGWLPGLSPLTWNLHFDLGELPEMRF